MFIRCFFVSLAAIAVSLTALAPALAEESRAAQTMRTLADPHGGVLVVAHRGCHNPAPGHNLPSAPENSLLALSHCLQLGADMMELDVRRTQDGALVIMHDPSVDRTTDGAGRVADLTLAQIKRLHLRENFGGEMSPILTDQRVPTLDDVLAAAKGRIALNLDIKEAIYPEVIAAAARAGVADQVLVKTVVGPSEPALADQTPYNAVAYMPVLYAKSESDPPAGFAAMTAKQASGRRKIASVEIIYLDQAQFEAVRAAAQRAGIRIWTNALTEVGVLGVVNFGGDIDALRDNGRTWGRLIHAGISVIQTDEPAALLDYLKGR